MKSSLCRATLALLCTHILSAQAHAADAPAPTELPKMTVNDTADGAYTTESPGTATKADISVHDIPQSIQTIPRAVLEDRQVVRINELTDNISGVQHTPGYEGISSITTLFIRGFEQGPENYRNGFRDYGYLAPRDVSNIETFEILKGPGSALYGGGVYGVGGVVNTVTKKPLATSFDQLNLTAGNYDFYRAAWDSTGPISNDASLLYRLNVAAESAGGFRDYNKSKSVFVTPVVSWQIAPATKITIELEYANDARVPDDGFPSEPESFQLPINRFLGIPGLNDESTSAKSITYTLEHEFNENWRFRQGLNVLGVSQNIFSVYAGSLADDRRTLTIYPSLTHETQRNYTLQNELFGKFTTGSVHHNALIGVELARLRDTYIEADASPVSMDIFNPDYHITVPVPSPDYFQTTGVDNLGVYAQDFVELLPRVKVLAGGRFDINKTSYDAGTPQEQSNGHFTPRVGLVYQPDETTSLYAGWSTSFNPSLGGKSRTGTEFKPESAEQYEIGLKQSLLQDAVSLNVAAYQLTRQNVLTPDPVDPMFSIQTGEQQSRGIEVDMAGQLRPGWKMIATYAYTHAVVTEDNQIPVGDRLRGVPKNGASLWTTYEIQGGSLQGLGFGAGLYYAGAREQQLPNNLVLPSYVRTDAAISYQHAKVKYRLNIKNLFSVKYYEVGPDGPYPRAPLTVLGEVSIGF
jgi:iron complex outermembrane recepter protein